ncbi:hypothetical protein ACFQER_02380 [Halomicroarcula sp. GCM10025894]|uniref:hypothetical protein n=1 Tax=Halomicroarcula sp. GCM10025894 TaxID=3252673 RepID=UPI003615BFF1
MACRPWSSATASRHGPPTPPASAPSVPGGPRPRRRCRPADHRRRPGIGAFSGDHRRAESLYELDDTAPVEQWLEGVVTIGCRRLGLPYGFVTSIDGDTQHVIAAVGDHDQLQAGSSAPLSAAYCEYTVQNDDVVGFGDLRDADWVDDGATSGSGWPAISAAASTWASSTALSVSPTRTPERALSAQRSGASSSS